MQTYGYDAFVDVCGSSRGIKYVTCANRLVSSQGRAEADGLEEGQAWHEKMHRASLRARARLRISENMAQHRFFGLPVHEGAYTI